MIDNYENYLSYPEAIKVALYPGYISQSNSELEIKSIILYTTNDNQPIINELTKSALNNEYDATRQCFILKFAYEVQRIPSDMFWREKTLTSIELPSTVAEIGLTAFGECSNLVSIKMPNVTEVGLAAFLRSGLTTVTIPGSLKRTAPSMFVECSNLTSVIVESGVEIINQYCFTGCPNLTSIILPNTIIDIYSYAFQNCHSLTSVTIPNSIHYSEPLIGLQSAFFEGEFETYPGSISTIICNGITYTYNKIDESINIVLSSGETIPLYMYRKPVQEEQN